MDLVGFVHRHTKPVTPTAGTFYWVDVDGDDPQIWFAPSVSGEDMILLNDNEIGSDRISALESMVSALESRVEDDEDVIGQIQERLNSVRNELLIKFNDYAKKSDLDDYATKESLDDYAKTSDLDDYAKKSDLDDYAKTSDLDDYVKTDVLEGYATKGDLDDYVKTDVLEDYATKEDLEDFEPDYDLTDSDFDMIAERVKLTWKVI